MQSVIKVLFAACCGCFLIVSQASCQSGKTVFVASTPCSAGTKPLPGIPASTPCDLIQWNLTLLNNTAGSSGGTYILDCNYGMSKQGTRSFINGGHYLHREGKWIRKKGDNANQGKVIYQLDPDQPNASVSFLRVSDNLLHLLDSRQQLMIGTGAWAYTLNKQ